MTRRKRKYRLFWWSLLSVILFSGYLVKSFPGIYNFRLTSPKFYLNAGEIYRHYFSGFRLSAVAREQVLTELRMLVNALALERARGEDLSTTLIIMDAMVRKKIASTETSSELINIDTYLRPYADREAAKQRRLERHPAVFAPDVSDTRHVPFAAYIRSQSALVDKYDLPYRIPASTLQVMDIRGNRFLKVIPQEDPESHGGRTDNKQMLAKLERFNWETADILFGRSKRSGDRFSVQGYWNHAGLYDSSCDCIIDAWPDGKTVSGGVRRSSKAFWAAHFDEIAVLRLSDIPRKIRKAVERHAAAKVAEPYNLGTYKMNPAGGWYCSKLVYYAYLQECIDLDPNGGVAVMPDDIAISRGLNALEYLSR